MAVLPAHWFGPDVPQPAYWIALLGILATRRRLAHAYALRLTRSLGDSACELGRPSRRWFYRALARGGDGARQPEALP